jgi:RND family efflux transporter MFP subunit
MKKLRAIIYLLLFLIGAGILIMFASNYINQLISSTEPVNNQSASSNDQKSPDNTLNTTEQPEISPSGNFNEQEKSETNQPVVENSKTVSVTKIADLKNSYTSAIGTVKSARSASIFPATSGTVQAVNFQEGDYVEAKQPIITLTGNNFTEHPAETTLKLARTTYQNAETALANLKLTNSATLKAAGLQLQSAVNNANAIAYDLAIIEQNIAGQKAGLNIIDQSSEITSGKNDRDAAKVRQDIDDLIFTLNKAQDDRNRTRDQLETLQSADQSTQDSEQIVKLQTALDAQEKGIEELYSAIDKAKFGYTTALDGADLGENQLQSQMIQLQNQIKVLDLNLQSAKTKLGYTGETSDPLELAKQNYASTKLQLEIAGQNAENQLKLAKLSLEQAESQAAALSLKAPFSGIIASLTLAEGEIASPQAAAFEIIDPSGFELEVGVDAATADRLDLTAPALVKLAGRELEVPIRSISPKLDEKTKLIKVTLELPNIIFKANQNLEVKLPLASGQISGSTYLPLDAVTIGTESQFVFVNDNGKAKRLEVKLGQITGDLVEITSGLSDQDEVILEGAKTLTEGDLIIVK